MAEMVGAAFFQEAVSRGVSFLLGKHEEKPSQGHNHNMERLKMAVSQLKRCTKPPISDQMCLQVQSMIKRSYVEARELRYKHISSSASLKPGDVRRFEWFAQLVNNTFVRDVESEFSLRHYCPVCWRTSLRQHVTTWLQTGWCCLLAEEAAPTSGVHGRPPWSRDASGSFVQSPLPKDDPLADPFATQALRYRIDFKRNTAYTFVSYWTGFNRNTFYISVAKHLLGGKTHVDFLSWSYGVIVTKMKRMYLTLHGVCTASFVKYCTPTDGIKEQQERCSKYSQQAIGFAIPTFSGYVVSESSSTRDTATVKRAVVAAFFVAITADLLSWRMKPERGRVILVYISFFHLLLMTFLVSISFDESYGYAALFVPLIVTAVVLLQRKLRSGGVRRRSTDDDDEQAVSQDCLDFMFDLSALILNWDSIITIIGGQLPSAGPNNCVAASAAGFLFFSTIVLSLFLLMVATVRAKALTAHVKHLDVLLILLLVSTLFATATASFLYFSDQEMEWEVPT
ncbi:hypothetical protein U9M48_031000 [Paspalum notatum var. saurae]|uniref:Uncharacterized protein n=1 Tax=Paspalum notatum var. saurae TaxID=547442 RepID=A0AAQ3X497_PASNO